MCVSCLIGLAGVDGLGGDASNPTYADLLALCALADDPAKASICTSCLNKAKASGIPVDFLKNSALDVFMEKCEKNPVIAVPPPAAGPACGAGYMQLSFLGQQYGQTCQSKLLVAGVGLGSLAAAFLIWRHYAR